MSRDNRQLKCDLAFTRSIQIKAEYLLLESKMLFHWLDEDCQGLPTANI